MPNEHNVALNAAVDRQLHDHLLRPDGQEDLTFALWTPSDGQNRRTALLHTPILPAPSERAVHGNASFQTDYFERALRIALKEGCGLAFLHSHPFPGWQGMSPDDIRAESRMAGAVSAATELPLFGMTVGSDGVWSARLWIHAGDRRYERVECPAVRVVGPSLRIHRPPALEETRPFRDLYRRTVSVWGPRGHAELGRLRIGIVGLGSVGAMVAEVLARMGLRNFVLIDYDRVQAHNLDRLVIATEDDIGRLKVAVAERRIRSAGTAADLEVTQAPYSVVEEAGYRAALDCDVLFSCVDRPRPRSILDHMAFAHLIPVIDGGIQVRFKGGEFTGVDWQVQMISPGRACMECLGAYDPADVSTEAAGKLDDPTYLAGLPKDHRFRRNENVFPFAANLASLETLHLVALVTGAAGITDFGVQRFRYVPGILEQRLDTKCTASCDRAVLEGQGDRHFTLMGKDLAATISRENLTVDDQKPVTTGDSP